MGRFSVRLFVCLFVRSFVREAQPARPEAQPARPEAQPARPEAQPARPEAQPARPEAQPASQPTSGFRPGWLGLRPGWLGLRPSWMARGGMYGQTDGRTNERTDVRKIFPFYRTLSPIGAAAQKTGSANSLACPLVCPNVTMCVHAHFCARP